MSTGAFDVRAAVSDPGNFIDFVVPEGQRWRVLSVGVTLITSVAAGNRNLRVELISDGVARGAVESGVNIGPSSMGNAILGPGAHASVSQQNGASSHPLPTFVLKPGEAIRVCDGADIDSSADIIRARLSFETTAD